ncbi:MAG: 1-deoxy-D-xylulose-5-phosphate synthase, partial [Lachnospiraceae bacterium]|nr:1-deoxy-D-xylulose-5-phosphate synthase [Lachnospiraceae bacterium]
SPTAVRYPRGAASQALVEFQTPIKCGECEWIAKEGEILLLAVGSMVETADKVRRLLKAKRVTAALVNVRFLSPIDETMIAAALSYKIVVTLEENVARGGFGEEMAGKLLGRKFAGKFLSVALPNQFIEHGSQEELKRAYGLDADNIIARLRELEI